MATLGTATSACSQMCSPTVLKYHLTSSIPEKSLEIFSNCLKAFWIMSSEMSARISGSALGKWLWIVAVEQPALSAMSATLIKSTSFEANKRRVASTMRLCCFARSRAARTARPSLTVFRPSEVITSVARRPTCNYFSVHLRPTDCHLTSPRPVSDPYTLVRHKSNQNKVSDW